MSIIKSKKSLAFFLTSAILLSICALTIFSSVSAATGYTVGPQETILTYSQRITKGLDVYFDGSMGVVYNGTNYDYYAPNGSYVARTRGPLNNIANTVQYNNGIISGVPAEFPYASGGPIYKIDSNNLLMFVHLERWPGGDSAKFYATYGLARSTDGGSTWSYIGEIIAHDKPYDPNPATATGIANAGASFAIKDGYFYVYLQDCSEAGVYNALGVARAPVTDVVNAALLWQTSPWYKYYNGGFTEPGLGGRSTQICNLADNLWTGWISASYNTYLNKVIIAVGMYELDALGNVLATVPYMTTTADGYSNLEPWTKLFNDTYEDLYVNIVGNGTDPIYTGNTFYLYYTRSYTGGWNRWSDATIERRQITVSSGGPTPTPTPTPTPVPGDTTVDFEAYTTNGQVISGIYAGIDWGNAAPQWTSWAPFGGLTSRCAYVDSTSTSAVTKTINLPANKVMKSVKIGRIDGPDATVTLHSSVAGNPDQTYTITTVNRGTVFTTGWTYTSATPTVDITITCSGSAWNVGFDDLVYGDTGGGPTPTPTPTPTPVPGDTTADFEAYTANGQVISGTYAGINWGNATPQWTSWGPFGGLTSRCAYVDSTSTSAVTKTINLPANKVMKSVKIGRIDGPDATVTLHSSVAGNPDQTYTITTVNRGTVFTTGWTNVSSSPTVDITITCSGSAWNVAFDDLVYGN